MAFLNPRSEVGARIENMLKSTQKPDGHQRLEDYSWAPRGERKNDESVPKRSKVWRPKKEKAVKSIKKRGWKQISKVANHWDREHISLEFNIFNQLKVLEDSEEYENRKPERGEWWRNCLVKRKAKKKLLNKYYSHALLSFEKNKCKSL